ncbi:unnamed protein product, partial [Timema podura]|nr:unnamed protein product [Timema podura]
KLGDFSSPSVSHGQGGLYVGSCSSFNGLSLWLPEVFNIMGAFSSSHPESYATTCEIIGSTVEALTVSLDTSATLIKDNASILLNVLTHEAVPMMVNRSAVSTSSEISGCDTSIDPSAFQNTLIVGVVATCVSFTGGYIVNYVGKKRFLLFLLVTATGCGFGLNFASTTTSVLILSCVFVTFSGLSANLVSSTVVDVFPTHLRSKAGYSLPMMLSPFKVIAVVIVVSL